MYIHARTHTHIHIHTHIHTHTHTNKYILCPHEHRYNQTDIKINYQLTDVQDVVLVCFCLHIQRFLGSGILTCFPTNADSR